jgi:hypothetical protein
MRVQGRIGNLSTLEQVCAAVLGVAVAYAGYCAVKAAVRATASRHSAKSNAVDRSVEDSFPASDPPASRLPDEPPINAEAKWAAARAAERP